MHRLSVLVKQFFVIGKMVVLCFPLFLTTSSLSVCANAEESSQQAYEQSERKDNDAEKGWFTGITTEVGILTAGSLVTLTSAGAWLYNKLSAVEPPNPHASLKKFKSELAKMKKNRHPASSLLGLDWGWESYTPLLAIPTFRPPEAQLKKEIDTGSHIIKTKNIKVIQILNQIQELADRAVRIIVEGNEEPEKPRMDVVNRVRTVLGYDMQRLILLIELIDVINQNNLIDDEGLLYRVCAIADALENIFSYQMLHNSAQVIEIFVDHCITTLEKEEKKQSLILLEKVVSFLAESAKTTNPSILDAPRPARSNIDLSSIIERFSEKIPGQYRSTLIPLLSELVCCTELGCDCDESKHVDTETNFLKKWMLIQELLDLKVQVNPQERAKNIDHLNEHYYDVSVVTEDNFICEKCYNWDKDTTFAYRAITKGHKEQDKLRVMIKRTKLSGLPFTHQEFPRNREDELKFGPGSFVNEYVTGPLYLLALHERAPIITLVSCQPGVLAFRSKFLANFKNLSTDDNDEYYKFVSRGNTSRVFDGMEKVFAAMLLFGEADIHEKNLGYIYVDEHRSVLAKIDHGRSVSCISSSVESLINSSALFNGTWGGPIYSYPININKFIMALEQLLSIPESEFETIVNRRIMELVAEGLSLTNITYYWWLDGQLQESKFKTLAELQAHYVDNMKKQRITLGMLLERLNQLIQRVREGKYAYITTPQDFTSFENHAWHLRGNKFI